MNTLGRKQIRAEWSKLFLHLPADYPFLSSMPDESSGKDTNILLFDFSKGLNKCLTYSGVEAQVTDVTRDDGFLLGRSDAKSVVDHCLLHWIHL